VPDGVSADQMTNFLSQVFGVVARALHRLRHKNDLQTGLMMNPLWVLDVSHENQIAKAVHLGVGAQPTEPVRAILSVTGDWQRSR